MKKKLSNPEHLVFEEPAELRPAQQESATIVAYDPSVEKARLLWVQRSFLLRAVGLGLILSVLVAFLIPSRYTSTVRLMPPDQGSSGLATIAAALTGRTGSDSAQGLGSMAGDLLGLKSTSDIFVGILSSRTTEDEVIGRFNLQKVYHDRHIEDARDHLERRTKISVDRKSQIIMIEITDKNPQRAAEMARTYVAELNTLVAELSTSSARRERIFLEERLKQVNRDLEAAEKAFSQFASQNTAIDIPAQGKAMVEAAAVLQGQLIAAESELQGLKQIYSDSNVRVRTLSARVSELQDQLDKLGGQDEGTVSSSHQTSIYPSIRKLPLLGVSYADLYRATRVQEAVFTTLTQEYELAKVQEAKDIPTVKVLDSPDVPSKKSFPPRLAIIFLGTLLSFVMAVTWIHGNSVWQRTNPGDPRKLFFLEIVSTIRGRLPWVARNGSGKQSEIVHGWHGDRGSSKHDM